jgi:hypothetical protein
MIPFKAIATQMDVIVDSLRKKEEPVETPVVDMAEGEQEMELYHLISELERASDEQLRVVFGEMKPYKLNVIQRILDEKRDVPNY